MTPRLWFLVAIAILLPWQVYNVATDANFSLPPKPIGDGPDYECIGFNLSRNRGFSFSWSDLATQAPYIESGHSSKYVHLDRVDDTGLTTTRPPFLPWVISVVYRLIDRGPSAFAIIRIISALSIGMSGAIGVWLAASISSRTFKNSSFSIGLAAISALALSLFDKTIRTYATDFLSEPFALLAMSLFCCVAIEIPYLRKSIHGYVLMGLLLGWLILIRSMFVFWIPLLVLLVFVSQTYIDKANSRNSRYKNAIWSASIFASCTILVIAPWCVRNILVLERFMPMGTQGIQSLLGGYCEESLADNGNWSSEPDRRLHAAVSQNPLWAKWNSLQRETALADAAQNKLRTWIWDNPMVLPRLAALRIRTHWSPYFGPSLLWRLAILTGILSLLLFHRWEAWWMIGIPVISSLVVMLIYETGGRFLVPLYGLLYGLGGIGVSATVHVIWKYSSSKNNQ